MIKIAEVLPSHPSPLWKMVKQCGVDDVVAGFSNPPDPSEVHPDQRPWSFTNLMRMKAAFKDGGFNCDVIEARPSTKPSSACRIATKKSNTPSS